MANPAARLKDKVAVVTGAAGGIGKAICCLFAREGGSVVAGGRTLEKVEKVVAEINDSGRIAIAVKADVSDNRDVENLVNTTLEHFGRIDVLVNNAGIFEIVPTLEMTESQWDRMLNVNLKSVFLCSKAVLPHMIKRRSGTIVNIASDAGKTGGGIPVAHYAVSKAGIICLTKALAREFAPFNIRVNAVSPGLIETDLIKDILKLRKVEIPLGRLGKPEEAAQAVLFLAGDESDYITGEILDVNAGLVMD
jgi:3-oxoacyl-[acyl-carrier protein] reductase